MPPAIRLAAAAVGITLLTAPHAGAQADTCTDEATPDWMMSIQLSDSSARVRPADCATVGQTPPDFSWPDHGPGSRYEFRLTYPDGTTRSATTERNWIAWNEALPPGEYRWRGRLLHKTGQGVDGWSRRFVVSAGAAPFVVPEWTMLLARASATPRRRALPRGLNSFLASLAIERREGLTWLRTEADSKLRSPAQPEPAARSKNLRAEAHEEAKCVLNAAFAWVAMKQERYFADALRHALNLASWDPRGSTAYANVDLASNEIAWTLTLVYDWLSPRLDATQKTRLLAPLRVRIADMYDDVIGGRARVAIHPYDSVGNLTLTLLAAIA